MDPTNLTLSRLLSLSTDGSLRIANLEAAVRVHTQYIPRPRSTLIQEPRWVRGIFYVGVWALREWGQLLNFEYVVDRCRLLSILVRDVGGDDDVHVCQN